MKSIFRKILLVIISAVTVFACASCSFLFIPKDITGVYGNIDEKGFGYTYEFDGDEVTYSLWNNGEQEVLVKAPYEIKGGKLKIISDEYFHGSVEQEGKYVVSKSISFETDENGNEQLKIGINSFGKMEEEDLPENPEDDSEKNPEEKPKENPDPDNPQNPNDKDDTPTEVTVTELKNALIEASTTENKNFEATYTLSESYSEGTRTERIDYYMQIKAQGTDRYLKFKIESLNSDGLMSQGNSQIVEIWYKGGNSYIKARTWQTGNGKTMDDVTNSIKASGQSFDAVCQNLGYPITSVLGIGRELNSLISDTGATATSQNGTITYTLDCTGNTSALTSLYRVSKAFAVKILSDSFTDADVNYSVGSTSGLIVTYEGKYTPVSSLNATVNGTINFKTLATEITVPSDVSSATDEGAGYKSWYNSLEGIVHR